MAKYVVIKAFSDLQDLDADGKGHVYSVNDSYPRKGKAKKTRLDELSSDKNKVKEPVIALVEEVEEVEDVEVKVADE